MSSVNSVVLAGIVSSDVRPSKSPDGPVVFTISTTKRRPGGEDFKEHNFVACFGELGSKCMSLKPGDIVAVEGRLKTETRVQPSGKKNSVTQVIAFSLQKMSR